MLNDDVKNQSAGDASTNLQAGTIMVQQGLTYRDAKDIALDVYKENFLKLSAEASKVAIERAEELTDNFLSKLKEVNENSIESMGDPGMQIALYSAQKEYARTGDEDLQSMLVDILVERANTTTRDLKQIVLDESLEIAPRLTPEQFDVLTLSWVLTRTKHNGLIDLKSLENFIDSFILPFISTLSETSSCYEHLQYLGCGNIVQLGGWGNIEKRFREAYPGLFCKGISVEEVEKQIENPDEAKGLIIPCLHDGQLRQVLAMDTKTIESEAEKRGVEKPIVDKLKSIFEKSRMSEPEIKTYLLKTKPELEQLFNIWSSTSLKSLTLTTVGYAIAQANLRRRTGEKVDLSIWVK